MIEFHLQSIPESNHPESGKRLKRPKWCASPQQFMMSHVAIGSVTDIAPPALPPKADIRTQSRDVRFVPKADILRCGRTQFDHFVGGRRLTG